MPAGLERKEKQRVLIINPLKSLYSGEDSLSAVSLCRVTEGQDDYLYITSTMV